MMNKKDLIKNKINNLKGGNKEIFDIVNRVDEEFVTLQKLYMFTSVFQKKHLNVGDLQSEIRHYVYSLIDLGLMERVYDGGKVCRGIYKNLAYKYNI